MTSSTLLVLLALVVGLGAGAWLSRAFAAGRDERELARAREELANARADAAVARTEAAEARTGAAQTEAEVAGAIAQRDAAVARAQEIAADRQAMVDQFRLLSTEVAERQGRQVDTVAAQRLQATEQILAPVTASLELFQARLTEVEKERVAMATDLRAHVRSVRDTGEALRKETAIAGHRTAQAAGAWVVGRDAAEERRRDGRHGRALRLRPPGDQPGRRSVSAPTCGSTWPRASTSSSTPRCR